ncbi:MAG: GNAT family N-acetyltransferase [Lachnospiraceae bacterium]
MEVLRAEKSWQHAGAYYVRVEAMVKGFNIPLNKEFDDHDTPDTKYIVVLDNELPIGTCRLYLVDDSVAKIERVCVVEDARKRGVGQFAIKEAEKWLKELGIKKIIITSREEAVGFYEKLGYIADWKKKKDTEIFSIIFMEKVI